MTAFNFAAKTPSLAMAPSRAQVLAQWTRALSLLLFLSGAAAMIVELSSQPALLGWFADDAELATMLIHVLGLGLGCVVGGLLSRTLL